MIIVLIRNVKSYYPFLYSSNTHPIIVIIINENIIIVVIYIILNKLEYNTS